MKRVRRRSVPAPAGPKLTPELADRLAAAARTRVSLSNAAMSCGLDPVMLARWLDQGRKAKRGVYRDLVARLDEAVARSEVALRERLVLRAEGGDTHAAVWLLENSRNESITIDDPVELDRRTFLETALRRATADLEASRKGGRMTAVSQLTRTCVDIRNLLDLEREKRPREVVGNAEQARQVAGELAELAPLLRALGSGA